MGVLGINVGNHDSSLCLYTPEKRPVIYLTERLTKKKHAGFFPHHALVQALKDNPTFMRDLADDQIVVSGFGRSPQEMEQLFFEKTNPGAKIILEHMGLERTLFENNSKLATLTHHRSHAYSVLAQTPFKTGLILVVDGVGSRTYWFDPKHPEAAHVPPTQKDTHFFETLTGYHWNGSELATVTKEFHRHLPSRFKNAFISSSIGILYQSAAHVIFGDWTHAGKVMGMSAYGKSLGKITDSEAFIVDTFAQEWNPRKGKKEFDEQPKEEFKRAVDLACTVQEHFEERMWSAVKKLKEKYPEEENIMLVGGCALNCLFNSALMRSGLFKNVFVPPFPNDEGISLGAAWGYGFEKKLWGFKPVEWGKLSAALGTEEHDTAKCQSRVPEVFANYKIELANDIAAKVADILATGEVVAWIQGRSEVGPRALGHRSLLIRPDRPGVKDYLNQNVKFREDFRPYGASVLFEKVHEYVAVPANTHMPFMTFAPQILPQAKERLAGVTHEDGTCRIQTVAAEQNPRYYSLLSAFEKKTGLAVLLNTSLNIMGQPILEDIEDAKKFLESSPAVKFLAYGDYLISKA